MLKLLGWTIKLSLFACLVLVLGNWIRWKGATVSDHVRTGMAQVERKVQSGSLKPTIGNLQLTLKESPKALKSRIQNLPADQIQAHERNELRVLLNQSQ